MHKFMCFQMPNTILQAWSILIFVWQNDIKNYVTSEGAVYHNVLYYQQLSIDGFYANNNFE